jgi:hypothetical protein
MERHHQNSAHGSRWRVISAFGHIQTFLEESSDSWLSAVVPPTRPATTEQRQRL